MLYASRPANVSAPPPPSKRPTSPTFSDATTQASGLNINGGPEIIITRAHLRNSVQTYEELLRSCTAYRDALSTLSNAAAQFASSIEACSRLRGTGDDASVGFQAIAGLYHLIANQELVLSDSIRTQFDTPLRIQLQEYRQRIADRSFAYEQSLLEKNRIIRLTEAENMQNGRRGKKRDLASFRAALATLQKQVSDLDQLKAEYYTDVLAHEEETWDAALEKVSLVVRSSLEVYDRISAKSSDPSLEPILQAIPDPFDAYGPQTADDQIFSILPVGSILGNVKSQSQSSPSSPSPSTAPGSVSTESILHDQSVRTWMDQTAAARNDLPTDWYGSAHRSLTALGQEHGPVDWSDSHDARVRRHSLPTPAILGSSISPPSSSASSSTVPFPSEILMSEASGSGSGSSSGTLRPAHKREQSKLRQHLSVIGEGSSHSRESTIGARSRDGNPESSDHNNNTADDDDASTERGSDGGGNTNQKDETIPDDTTIRLDPNSPSLPSESPTEDGGGAEVRDDLSEASGPRWT